MSVWFCWFLLFSYCLFAGLRAYLFALLCFAGECFVGLFIVLVVWGWLLVVFFCCLICVTYLGFGVWYRYGVVWCDCVC